MLLQFFIIAYLLSGVIARRGLARPKARQIMMNGFMLKNLSENNIARNYS